MAVALALSLAGCSQTPSGIVPVSGRVTLSGKPLAGAVVTFQPVEPLAPSSKALGGAVGRTDSDGRFVLRFIEPDVAGAVAGRHVVTITTATTNGGDAALPTGELVPAAWRDGSQTYDVPAAGTDAANFDIP